MHNCTPFRYPKRERERERVVDDRTYIYNNRVDTVRIKMNNSTTPFTSRVAAVRRHPARRETNTTRREPKNVFLKKKKPAKRVFGKLTRKIQRPVVRSRYTIFTRKKKHSRAHNENATTSSAPSPSRHRTRIETPGVGRACVRARNFFFSPF